MNYSNKKFVFITFCQTLREQQLLNDNWKVNVEEEMVIILMAISLEIEYNKNGFNIRVKQLIDTLTTPLKLLLFSDHECSSSFSDQVPNQIRNSNKHWHFFTVRLQDLFIWKYLMLTLQVRLSVFNNRIASRKLIECTYMTLFPKRKYL